MSKQNLIDMKKELTMAINKAAFSSDKATRKAAANRAKAIGEQWFKVLKRVRSNAENITSIFE